MNNKNPQYHILITPPPGHHIEMNISNHNSAQTCRIVNVSSYKSLVQVQKKSCDLGVIPLNAFSVNLIMFQTKAYLASRQIPSKRLKYSW